MYILTILLVLATIIFIAPVAYAQTQGTSGGEIGMLFFSILGVIAGAYLLIKRFF